MLYDYEYLQAFEKTQLLREVKFWLNPSTYFLFATSPYCDFQNICQLTDITDNVRLTFTEDEIKQLHKDFPKILKSLNDDILLYEPNQNIIATEHHIIQSDYQDEQIIEIFENKSVLNNQTEFSKLFIDEASATKLFHILQYTELFTYEYKLLKNLYEEIVEKIIITINLKISKHELDVFKSGNTISKIRKFDVKQIVCDCMVSMQTNKMIEIIELQEKFLYCIMETVENNLKPIENLQYLQ